MAMKKLDDNPKLLRLIQQYRLLKEKTVLDEQPVRRASSEGPDSVGVSDLEKVIELRERLLDEYRNDLPGEILRELENT